MKILGIHWNPGNPSEILGIRRKSEEYNYNLENPKNLRNTIKIQGIRVKSREFEIRCFPLGEKELSFGI
jgi:hypothetical protein